MKAGDEWRLLRWTLVGLYSFIVIRVTISDYPWGMNLWQAWIQDKAGYWHEIAYISAWFWSMITSTFLWQLLDRKVKTVTIKRIEKV